MEKAKQVTREYLNDEKEELTSEQEIKKSEDIKIEINTLLHMYLPDHLTIAEVDALAMCMTEMIYNPEDFLREKPANQSVSREDKKEDRFKPFDLVEINFEIGQSIKPVHKNGTKGIIVDREDMFGAEAYKFKDNESGEIGLYLARNLKMAPEKSLHDQIREGGWEKVIELVGRSYKYCCGTDECGTKVDAYIKLLALSKVLNEGKGKGKYFFKVKVNEEGELYWVSNEICDQPIYFKDHMDVDFTLDFAEKEWRIFYNAKAE